MRPERGGSARRLACLTALGCLIGAATAAGTTFLSAAPAPAASCSSAKANVEGFRYSGHYGVRGFVYVNKNATVNAYYYLFVRSVLVKYDNSNWVEVGWLDHEYGVNGPTVFAFWETVPATILPVTRRCSTAASTTILVTRSASIGHPAIVPISSNSGSTTNHRTSQKART